MPELSSDAAHSPVSGQRARRVARRYLTGLSVAGVTAAVALAGAVSDASASPAASPSRVVTLTSSSSAPTGHLTVQVKYRLAVRGRNKLVSVTYSGGTKLIHRHAALVISLVPALLPPFPGRGQVSSGGKKQVPIHFPRLSIILKIHNARQFSGALPAKVVASISKIFASRHRVFPGTTVLEATVASVRRFKKQVQIDAPAGLQVGVLLGPLAP